MRNLAKLVLLLFLLLVTTGRFVGSAEAPALKQIKDDPPIPVLMYHKITRDFSSGGRGLRVSPENFAWQMNYLSERGYTTITCEDLVNYLQKGQTLPAHPVLITFDDGYEDNYLNAFPIMKELKLKGTIFLVADQIGRYNTWDYNLGKQPFNKLMNWGQIKEMQDYGIEFGAHTLTHPRLAETPLPIVKTEVILSKAVLEEKLGVPVNSFAFPYGNYDANTVEIVRLAGYQCSFTTRFGPVSRDSSIFELPRYRVTGFTTRVGFASMLEGEGM